MTEQDSSISTRCRSLSEIKGVTSKLRQVSFIDDADSIQESPSSELVGKYVLQALIEATESDKIGTSKDGTEGDILILLQEHFKNVSVKTSPRGDRVRINIKLTDLNRLRKLMAKDFIDFIMGMLEDELYAGSEEDTEEEDQIVTRVRSDSWPSSMSVSPLTSPRNSDHERK